MCKLGLNISEGSAKDERSVGSVRGRESFISIACSEPTSPGMHLVLPHSCADRSLSVLLFFGVPCGGSLFLRFLLGMPSFRMSEIPSSLSPVCSLSFSRPANHPWLSASVAVGRSPGCIRSMDLIREIPES